MNPWLVSKVRVNLAFQSSHYHPIISESDRSEHANLGFCSACCNQIFIVYESGRICLVVALFIVKVQRDCEGEDNADTVKIRLKREIHDLQRHISLK